MDLIIRRNLFESTVAPSLVLRRNIDLETPSTTARVMWRYEDDPDMQPQLLGSTAHGTTLEVPFSLEEGRQIRISVISKTESGVESVAIIDNAEKVIFPSGPTFTSAVWNSVDEDIDLTFSKNSLESGDIQVEYKRSIDSAWLTHATDFAHNATSGTIAITQETDNVDYDLRLKQDGVTGYSVTRQVTVVGTGADTPPENLTAGASELSPCEWSIDLAWDAGTGSGDYIIQRKLSSGSYTTIDTTSLTSYTDSIAGSSAGARTYVYRVKQEDVDGYSNEVYVHIPRCFGEIP